MIKARGDWAAAFSRNAGADGKARLWVILLILAIGAFHLSTIRQGQDWGDDFGMYISHARNIVEGVDYAQTGYIYNPYNIISPKTYPPVYPLLLAPVYKLWGLNLTAMKVEIILIFLLSLFVIYLAFRDELPWPYLIALIALVGFNPFFWLFKDRILSDLPFLLFVYLSLHLIHQAYRTELAGRRRIIYSLATAVSIYLAYGTRSIGLALILCLIIYDLVRSKRPSLFAIQTTLVIAAFIYLQNKSSHNDGAYSDVLGFNRAQVVLIQSSNFIRDLGGFWVNGYSKVLWLALFAILSGLALAGYLVRIGRKKLTCFELFAPLYLGPFIILPIALETRYLIPIIPLYLFYAFLGARTLSRWAGIEGVVFASLVTAVLAAYAGQYTRLEFGPLREGVAKSESQRLFEYVKQETGEDEVIVFRKPRALALLTGRPAAVWHKSRAEGKLWDYFRQINASYLIIGPEGVEPEDQAFIRGFVERNHERLQETYTSADFRVYRIAKETQ